MTRIDLHIDVPPDRKHFDKAFMIAAYTHGVKADIVRRTLDAAEIVETHSGQKLALPVGAISHMILPELRETLGRSYPTELNVLTRAAQLQGEGSRAPEQNIEAI